MVYEQKNTNEIIYCFIDHQNLDCTIRKLGWNLDYKKAYQYLKTKYKCNKIFLFIGYVYKYKSFYDLLKSFGYIIIFKKIIITKDKIKGNCDAELILHSMIEFNNYDKAIIVTGDGDFYCLIEYLVNNNKLLLIGIPNSKRFSKLLLEFFSFLFFFDKLKNQLQKIEKEIIIYKLKENEKNTTRYLE